MDWVDIKGAFHSVPLYKTSKIAAFDLDNTIIKYKKTNGNSFLTI